ncbi:hypothetical protein K488DRAFT_88035 [Vararia minispora EC-137]|uniref:Uncharacterized protein n=1 Tax=Vararia minispora EC-137 TaxID=1314806 RepID=A0ACB8QER4_9AGAM|nr:hypothetical protein K488DRAFT_88035 [Vararia minispora EC-137]
MVRAPLSTGGGARFPYPKDVWSPAGGWWSQPKAWKFNTAVLFGGILVTTLGIAVVSWDREKRYVMPNRWIPSMMFERQFRQDPDAKKVAEKFSGSP